MSLTLFKMSEQYLALLQQLADSDFDEQTIKDTLEGSEIVESITDKAVNIVHVMRSLETNCEAIDAEINRLKELKTRRKANADKLEGYLLSNMEATGISQIDSPTMTIKIRNNPESVEVFEPHLVPSDFMEWPAPPPQKPNKTAIKAALKEGKEVQGCRLVRSKSLTVK
jgi:hypothetical protein